ncbi:monovalent cation/H+ antiporter subunit D [Limnobacter alexandrii]|jgi:multicomponent K+:H+ antiporter subunit D|uniref:monovalent cation/H+ antiporter subunit D n=1 Tax=Limnobacter alexandrii TaxID=2570352 RepID=UPI001BB10D1F|nr:monovalent cation/H+ antiporter subunit D [Limnobacter alexandrii]
MMRFVEGLMPHLIVAPILFPLVMACVMLLLGERRYRLKISLGLFAGVVNLAVALALLVWVKQNELAGSVGIYLPSNWDVPFGIVLVLDQLSALMLMLAALVGFAAYVFSMARWHKAGSHFHPLFLLQLMGINGAFLTGDLFNLFVFFEVMLAASYGLLLHGSGRLRVRSGLHYIAINLTASSLFLIGAAMIYGITGTLNMADLAAKIPMISDADRPLFHAGCAVLGVAFLAKAAMWPLNFWLVPAYSSASAPAAAVFALLTKVGVYVLLRLSTLLFSSQAEGSAAFGSDWLVWGGLLTMACGSLGVLTATSPSRAAAFSITVSSGILVCVVGLGIPDVTASALYYLLGSTFAVAALFLLTELMDRVRDMEAAQRRQDEEEDVSLPFGFAESRIGPDENLDDNEEALIGKPTPGSIALLGLTFIVCTLLVAGLPPLSGFLGKFAVVSALLPIADTDFSTTPGMWTLMVLLFVSGLFALVALTRIGIRFFWMTSERPAPLLRSIEYLPIALLIAFSVLLTVRAEVVMKFAKQTSAALHAPQGYIQAVLSAKPQWAPTNAYRLEQEAP